MRDLRFYPRIVGGRSTGEFHLVSIKADEVRFPRQLDAARGLIVGCAVSAVLWCAILSTTVFG
jgi:hypothetical protein